MKFVLQNGLPVIEARLTYKTQILALSHVLIDTGSAGSIFAADKAATIGISPDPQDAIYRIRGVGGSEFVFTRRIDSLAVGSLELHGFEIELGAMNYGFEIDGILGMDFLLGAHAVIDLYQLEILPAKY